MVGVVAHLHITVDNTVIMDGDTGQWTTEPPQLVMDQLKPGAKPKPWMRALMLTIADAAMGNKDTTATVRTQPNGWTLEVTNG